MALKIRGDAILIHKGDTGTIEVTVTQSDGVTPFDLTGYEIHFLVGENWSVTFLNLKISISVGGGGIVITNALNGVYEIRLLASDTSSMAAQQYFYATKGISPGGAVFTFSAGTFDLRQDLPHAA